MKKKFFLIPGFVLIIAAVIFHLPFFPILKEDHSIESSIIEEAEANQIVDFSRLITGQWEELLVIGPYTTRKEAEIQSNVKLNNIRTYNMDINDSQILLAFCKENKVVRYTYIKRNVLDFNWQEIITRNSSSLLLFSKSDTKFRISSGNKKAKSFVLKHLQNPEKM